MKKLFFMACFWVATISVVSAQSHSGFGIKGGLNYNSNGDYFESISNTVKHPDGHIGFHLGVFAKFGDRLFFKPELVYTNTNSDYDGDTFKLQKLDLPALVGIRVIGPINVFAGPSFQYILTSDYDGTKVDDFDKDISLGFNFGIGFSLNKFGIDLRYERGFSKNEADFIDKNNLDLGATIDARPSQLILSASIIL
ncbi:outer membrane beta-barrel protein [Formosa sp. S-31]|uniref:outer membrane beta-barrel protein n=1 Tax=Formosa sp. S-31 TaxID=2790949 RepID=UPI003EB7AD60